MIPRLPWILLVVVTCFRVLPASSPPDKSGLGPDVLSLPSGPGSIEGLGESFEPQLNTATHAYGVRLEVPAGRTGLAPVLRLAYNAGAGNSFLGLGWSLDLPAIRRQTDKGFPSYSDSDTFLHQGEELVPLSNPERDWRMENEGGFVRLRRIDTDGDFAPDAWEAIDRTGTRHTFGQWRGEGDRWSVVQHPAPPAGALTEFDRTFCWALDSTEDLHGNRIEYEYVVGDGASGSSGVLYPARIRYGLHRDVDLGTWHEVRFHYENRPDVFDDYRATFSAAWGRRLAGVDMFSHYDGQDHLVRRYVVEYAYRAEDGIVVPAEALDLGVSTLKRFVQYDRVEGSDNHLPPLLFEYTTMELAGAQVRGVRRLDLGGAESALPPELELADPTGNTQVADADGDSLPDILQTGNPGQRVVRNLGPRRDEVTGEEYLLFGPSRVANPAGALQLSSPETTLADFDADSLVDVARFTGSGVSRALEVFPNLSSLGRLDEVPAGFEESMPVRYTGAPSILSFASPSIRQMDANFDKISDFVRNYRSGLTTRFEFSMYEEASGAWRTIDAPFTDADFAANVLFEVGGVANPAVKLTDLNGDRLLDLAYLHKQGSGPSTTLRVYYWPYCGFGQWASRRELARDAADAFQIGGLDLADVFVQDLTGDGLADVFTMDGSSSQSVLTLRVNVAGRGMSAPVVLTGLPRYRPRDTTNPTTFRQADLNANGSTDLIWRNTGVGGSWEWLELQPATKPNLLFRYDNGLGKVSEVTYGFAAEDMVRAEAAGYPWTTKSPIPMQVVRRIRTTCGLDLDGIPDPPEGGTTDQYVTELSYRDAFYDAEEREFRGFAFAQRIDYGDDYLWDVTASVMVRAPGWDPARTPTTQVVAPTLVTRYRFLTGAPDGVDNDEYLTGDTGPQFVDELFAIGGREEEPLKGRQVWEEKIDPWALHSAAGEFGFDRGCHLAVHSSDSAEQRRMTPDEVVYARVRQTWGLRRLYRPTEALEFLTDLDADGDYSDPGESLQAHPSPAGRFEYQQNPVAVLPGNGRSVSLVYPASVVTELIEANGMMVRDNGWAQASPLLTLRRTDVDDYGNTIYDADFGVVEDLNGDAHFDLPEELSVRNDERVTRTTFALGGQALARWDIGRAAVARVEDENGAFVSETRNYYDAAEFAGGPLGELGPRSLLHRVEKVITGGQVPPIGDQTELPGDPRLPLGSTLDSTRTAYDRFGNAIAILDGEADATTTTIQRESGFPVSINAPDGHARQILYDARFRTYPASETVFVGGGSSPLTMGATYDSGFGVVTSSTDFNGNVTTYEYDSFARLAAIVRPYDSTEFPTQIFTYLPADPIRRIVYSYDRSGNLTIEPVPDEVISSRVITRAREQYGEPGTLVAIAYTDGCGRALASVGEDEVGGQWVVSKATSYSRRRTEALAWQPLNMAHGSSDADIPHFGDVWPGGRPPLYWVDGTTTCERTDKLADPLGREVITVQPPEEFVPLGEPVTRYQIEKQNLPLKVVTYDENDCNPASPHYGTPTSHVTDGLGRLIEVHETARLDDEGFPVPDVRTWITRYRYDLADQLIHITDAQLNEKWFRYDGLARKIFMNDPNRGVMTWTYDNVANVVSTVDAKAQLIEYQYDGANRLLTEDYRDENSEEFSYGFLYDNTQPITRENRPDVAYFYDEPVPGGVILPDFNIYEITNAVLGYNTPTAEQLAAWDADADGRLTVADIVRLVNTGLLRRNELLIAENTRGHLAYVWDTSGEEHVSYDLRGRASWEVKAITAAVPLHLVVSTGVAYDSLDRVSAIKYPDGSSVVYLHNSRGLPHEISSIPAGHPHTKSTLRIVSAYNPSGHAALASSGNNIETTRAFDPRLRLAALAHVRTEAPNDPITSYEYTYDGTGNMLQVCDRRPATVHPEGDPLRNTQVFAYDDIYRLVRADFSFSLPGHSVEGERWVANRFDRIGNSMAQHSNIDLALHGPSMTEHGAMMYGGEGGRWRRIGRSQQDPPGPHALTSTQSGRTLRYDANGNALSFDEIRVVTDAKDRMIASTLRGISCRYFYDSRGRRVAKVSGKGLPLTSMSGCGRSLYPNPYFESHRSGVFEKYAWQGDSRIAMVGRVPEGEGPGALARVFFHEDHIGSVQAVSGLDSTTILEQNYLPFGVVRAQRLSTEAAQSGSGRFQYLGKELDAETGFSQMDHRYCSTTLGRFTSVDPMLTTPSGQDAPYAYTSGNPMTY